MGTGISQYRRVRRLASRRDRGKLAPVNLSRTLSFAAVVAVLGACRSQPPDPGPQSQHSATVSPSVNASVASAADATTPTADAGSTAEAPAPEGPLEGKNFVKEVQADF